MKSYKICCLGIALGLAPVLAQSGSLTANNDFSSTTSTTTSTATTSESFQAAAPVKSAKPKVAETEAFDNLRGNAYSLGAFGNQAGAFTVNDYLAWPHMMGGEKFIYVEPTAKTGTASAQLGGNSFFINLQNASDNNGQTTIGMAKADAWGASVVIGKNRTAKTTETPGAGTADETITYQGDVLGANFSMLLGENALSAAFTWKTFENQSVTKANAQAFDDYNLNVLFSNFPAAHALIWTGGLILNRHNKTEDVTGLTATTTNIDPESQTSATLLFSLGSKVLSNQSARVLVGLDNSLSYVMLDNIDPANPVAGRESASGIVLKTVPNIVGEYAFNENWLAFGGAKHEIEIYGYETGTSLSGSAAAPVKTGTVTNSEIKTGTTTASIGGRYQNGMLALETALSSAVFADGPSTVFAGKNVLLTFGAFLNF